MRHGRARLILPACLAAVAWAAAARAGEAPRAGPDGTLVAGNKGWLWIVRNIPGGQGEKDTFTVAARQAGKKWRPVARDIEGRVVAAAAIDDQLHLIFSSGKYMTFRQGDTEGGPQKRLSSGALAAAAAPGFGARGKTVLLAVAKAADGKSAPATRPSTRAASRPASPKGVVGLLVLVYSGKANIDKKPWRPIALLEGVAVAREWRVMTAVFERTVYVLVANAPSGANQLISKAWGSDEWRDVPLSGSAAGARVLGMCVAGGRLVLLLAEPAGGGQAGRKLSLAVFSAKDTAEAEYHPVKAAGKARTPWPAKSLPAVTGFGDELVLLWQADEKLKLAVCSIAGALEAEDDVTIFAGAGDEGQAEKLYIGVMWGLMVAIFAMTFIRRPYRPLEPFQLPAGTRPAQMSRRIIAALLDLLPFGLMATIILVPDGPRSWDELREFLDQTPIPDNFVYSQLLSIGLYTAYATAMEIRFGTTLGKRLFALRVVGHAGAKPAPRDIVLRNIVRAVPLCWSGVWMLPLLLIVFPMINRNRQRMGDMLARTAVIDARLVPAGPEAQPSDDDGADDSSQAPDEDGQA